ncbi:hypothetical protein PAXRUDRAFT_832980 [Paxillus rubicundulus Ve08.2h10]|uniref:Queuosine 5'-phosphate N-glycosylase/hydrolase n=1 Tax=Paxillus rubicundulus Ve08.2h10 TaxID=930991 RepID=A0A0D0CER4_9AGAM|nr:hypothetical protein PAXRUDRAFT_832980 [Paxillus rubicundulus Ve08.2h10]
MGNRDQKPLLPVSYVDAVKQSCRELREAQCIEVTDEAIKRLLFSPSFLTTFKRVSSNHGLKFPLKFPSVLSELNLLCVLSLLNFASGYRVPLHQQTGRGAWDNIRALAFGLYLSSATGQDDLLSAKGMKSITPQQVAEFLSVNIHVERPHEELPGVTIGELGGPIYELVNLIRTTLNETGEILEQSGVPDLGSFVLRSLTSKRSGGNASVDDILEELVSAFPAFQDMAVVDDTPVYCFKKALFLIHAVTLRFGSSSPPPFPLPDTTQVPVFTDNVLPSMLIHLGVLDLSEAKDVALRGIFPDATNDAGINALLAVPDEVHMIGPAAEPGMKSKTAPPKAGPTLTLEQAYILRAAAVDACEKIVEYARSLDSASLSDDQEWLNDITLPQLDMWLWAVAKDRPDYRELERFVTRDTIFF